MVFVNLAMNNFTEKRRDYPDESNFFYNPSFIATDNRWSIIVAMEYLFR